MNQNSPYILCNKNTTDFNREVDLFKLKDGRYQIDQWGYFGKILLGGLLVENKIGEILRKYVSEQIELTKIVILRRATKEEWLNYSELKIINEIDYEESSNIEISGLKIYKVGKHICVSSNLKSLIEKELDDLTEIEFKKGNPPPLVFINSSGPLDDNDVSLKLKPIIKKIQDGNKPEPKGIGKSSSGLIPDAIIGSKEGVGFDPNFGGQDIKVNEDRSSVINSSNDLALPKDLKNSHQESKKEVSINVYAPPLFVEGNSEVIQVWMFLPEFKKKVKKRAQELDDEASRLAYENLFIHIEKETEVKLSLSCKDIDFYKLKSLTWLGTISHKNFIVDIPNGLAQKKLIFTLEVYVNDLIVGEIIFLMKSSQNSSSSKISNDPIPVGEKAKRFKKAFISYTSKDRLEVLKIVRGIAATNTYEIFQDIMSLDAGERWEKRLYEEIDLCDVFFLFWSEASSNSQWVIKEMEYALGQKRDETSYPLKIQPVIIPPKVKPPKQLNHLHFNDKIIPFIIAEEQLRKS